jgi:glutathione synthase/RimK-type ligase-like ATP-grasp enzyme
MDEEAAAGLGEVLPAGATRLLNWRHNLGQGATVKMLDPSSPEVAPALRMALGAAGAMNLAYGSVDVIEGAGGPRVMEVNSGLMMEFLARSIEGGYELARRVYRRAFGMMFE